ncbi:MAG: hypothetical protein U0R69_13715 [Gaiellales bacterium]
MTDAWTVALPERVSEPFEVYVNGVLQQRDVDYTVDGRSLRFLKPLAQEGKLGPVRWLSIFLGIAGTYRKNDSVDVVYQRNGRQQVATGLPISPPSAQTPANAGG